VLLWGLAVVAVAQVGLVAAKEWWRPELHDPEYGCRLARLRARLAEARPGRPLVLALGNSRAAQGVRPAVLETARPDADGPLLFNFARTGAGPLRQLLFLRRLLADGIRPDLLLVEVWAPQLHLAGGLQEEDYLPTDQLRWRDLGVVRRYAAHPRQRLAEWFQAQLAGWWQHRFLLQSFYLRDWLTRKEYLDGAGFRFLDDYGWLDNRFGEGEADPATHGAKFALGRRVLRATGLADNFHVEVTARAALQEIVDCCRLARVRLAFVVLPETAACQSCYPPAANAEVAQLLEGFRREQDVPTVNARNWIGDPLDFIDGYHLTPRGAAKFTRRLAAEPIPALLQRPI
jgi:hypothetical protein